MLATIAASLRLKPVLQAGENQVGFKVVEAAGGRILVIVIAVFQTRRRFRVIRRVSVAVTPCSRAPAPKARPAVELS